MAKPRGQDEVLRIEIKAGSAVRKTYRGILPEIEKPDSVARIRPVPPEVAKHSSGNVPEPYSTEPTALTADAFHLK